ncbi:MAG: ABC transporter ATP-binding protein [Microvirga sp.]
MSEPLLAVSSLSVAFGRRAPRHVVSGVSFDVGAGETVALVGESGSGKSVTALAIMGLLAPSARVTGGRIVFTGQDCLTLDAEARRRLRGDRIGMIFQEPMTSLNPVLPIGRQMTEALELHRGLDAGAARRLAVAMLDRVGIAGAAARLAQYPHEFSGGMRQRVMIAAVMALEPRLVIADEPTTALDVTVQAQILDLMRGLAREAGTSLLLITHDMGVVAEMADRVVVMRQGQVVETADVGALFRTPRQPYTRALLAAVPRIDAPGPDAASPEGSAQAAPEAFLRLSGIVKAFGSSAWRSSTATRALDGVTLDVSRGETVALVGESGSGKSTLGRIAVRLTDPDAGRILIDGEDVTRLAGARLRAARAKVQFVFQDPYASLDPRFTIARILAEPLQVQGRLGRGEIRERVASLIERVGLPAGAAARLPHEFSGGQRQRIAIARALAVDPAVVVADEPTSALDVSVQARILDLLADLQRERSLGLLFITHDLAVVRKVAHRVAVMRAGRILEIGPAADVLDAPCHPYTRALLSAAPVPDPSLRARTRIVCPPDAPSGPLRPVSALHWVAS